MDREYKEQWHRECAYAHFICSVPGMGIKTTERLYRKYGIKCGYESVYRQLADVVHEGEKACKEMLGMNERQITSLIKKMKENDVREEYQKLLYNKIWCIPKYVRGYPDKLKQIYDPPSVIYVKGDLPDANIPMVAVVGARNCSAYGEKMAMEIGKELADAGIPVISGMARGVDGISQRSALDSGGISFGVLGCGADICYPEENLDIYQTLTTRKGSGVISEYAPGTLPAPGLFPLRNRIISGLCDVLVVVEAREKSGTYITVTTALEQGKDVYVVPGRIGDNLSYGCNRLIAQGANVLYDVKKFVREFITDRMYIEKKQGNAGNEKCESDNGKSGAVVKGVLTEEEIKIYNGLDLYYKPMEELLAETLPQLPLSKAMGILATLECKGLAESEGGFYRKKIKNGLVSAKCNKKI